jgi:hypothetical protein
MAETGEYSADAGQFAQQALRTMSASTQRYNQVLEDDWRGQVDGGAALGFKREQEPGRCQRISLCFLGLTR